MKLYGSIISPYVARVVYAARLKGLTLEPEMPANGIKTPEFLKLNPIGKMPALEVDGGMIAESMVMLDYLEEACPKPALLPTSVFERARARLLGRIVDLYVVPSSAKFFSNMNPEKRSALEIEEGKVGYFKALAQLEHFMGAGPYALENKIGYADCAMLPVLQMMTIISEACGIRDSYAGLPKLSRWWQQMQADPISSVWVNDYGVAFQKFISSRR